MQSPACIAGARAWWVGYGMAEAMQPVVVGLSGGLGNQMFQYAAGRALAHRLGHPLSLDLSWFQGRGDRHFALAPFHIAASLERAWPRLPPAMQAQLSRLSRRWAPRIMGAPVFREPHFHYVPAFAALAAPVFLEGYWQSERYFRELREPLLQDFSLRQPLPASCQPILAAIGNSDAICVHVRRGDYLSNPVAAKVHGVCPVDYYQQGVAELSASLARSHCFVFSDDPEWVRASLAFTCPMTVVDVNGPAEAHFDLALMAACQHFVIANSSLSWWGAWLGQAAGKRVIAPARWFLTSDKDSRDLLPESWLRR